MCFLTHISKTFINLNDEEELEKKTKYVTQKIRVNVGKHNTVICWLPQNHCFKPFMQKGVEQVGPKK